MSEQDKSAVDIQLLRFAVSRMALTLDALVGACLDEKGQIKAPSRQAFAVARGCLQSRCESCPEWFLEEGYHA